MRARCRAVTALALTAVLGIGLTAPASADHRTPHKRSVAVGYGGAVVSDTEPATRAGIEVLRHGGNAADAAVAVAATLGVTDPYVAGIGGGDYIVYYNARTHRVSAIDGRETTPMRATSKLFIDPDTGKPYTFPTAVTTGLSVGVPGTLMSWQTLLDRFGTYSMARALRPAERVADRGFRITAPVHEMTRENAFRFSQITPTEKLFMPGGKLRPVGSLLRNPDLAATYRLIGRRGIGAFYGGEIGRDVVHTVHHLPLKADASIKPIPGLLSLSDLRGYGSPVRRPTHVNYRGYDVYGMPPSSSGGITTGEALNILGDFDLSHMTRVQALHHYLEASRLAFADRNRYIGDSSYVHVPQRRLLSKRFARGRACLIDPHHALTSPVAPGDPYAGSSGCTGHGPTKAGQPKEGTNTNHFVVTDRWGNVVSCTNTIEQLGGSGFTVPGRGFMLNNELTDYDFTPLQPGVPDPNLPAPGKRPRSSMNPTIVLSHGHPYLAVGSPGGASIITTVLQILVDKIDFGMSLPQAIWAPRASQRNSATTQVEPAFLKLSTTPGLEKLGQKFAIHDTSPLDPSITIPPTIGVADGVQFLGHGRLLAAGERGNRRGGSAAAVLRPTR